MNHTAVISTLPRQQLFVYFKNQLEIATGLLYGGPADWVKKNSQSFPSISAVREEFFTYYQRFFGQAKNHLRQLNTVVDQWEKAHYSDQEIKNLLEDFQKNKWQFCDALESVEKLTDEFVDTISPMIDDSESDTLFPAKRFFARYKGDIRWNFTRCFYPQCESVKARTRRCECKIVWFCSEEHRSLDQEHAILCEWLKRPPKSAKSECKSP